MFFYEKEGREGETEIEKLYLLDGTNHLQPMLLSYEEIGN